MRIISHLLFSVLIAFCLIGCEKDKTPTGPRGPVTFEVPPVDYSSIRQATPLGNINPPDHTFPTDHIYFYLNGSDMVEVRSMASGTITQVYFNTGSNDYRIELKHTETCRSYLDHIKNPFAEIEVGAQLSAGDPIGYGDPTTAAVDLGVVDYDTTRSFIIPARYHEFSLHCGNPYLYFADEVRQQLLEKNPRTAAPRGGKIDFDIDGALAGNWFLEGTPVSYEASSYLYGENQLAFVYDMYDPLVIRICAGGTVSLAPFNFQVRDNAPDPREVTSASGMVKYELACTPTAVLAVQLLASRRIKVEVFPNTTAGEVSGFSADAHIYVR